MVGILYSKRLRHTAEEAEDETNLLHRVDAGEEQAVVVVNQRVQMEHWGRDMRVETAVHLREEEEESVGPVRLVDHRAEEMVVLELPLIALGMEAAAAATAAEPEHLVEVMEQVREVELMEQPTRVVVAEEAKMVHPTLEAQAVRASCPSPS
jgi:hypothetical protein